MNNCFVCFLACRRGLRWPLQKFCEDGIVNDRFDLGLFDLLGSLLVGVDSGGIRAAF